MVADRDHRHSRCHRGQRVVELDLPGHEGRAAGRLYGRHHLAAAAADDADAARGSRGVAGDLAS